MKNLRRLISTVVMLSFIGFAYVVCQSPPLVSRDYTALVHKHVSGRLVETLYEFSNLEPPGYSYLSSNRANTSFILLQTGVHNSLDYGRDAFCEVKCLGGRTCSRGNCEVSVPDHFHFLSTSNKEGSCQQESFTEKSMANYNKDVQQGTLWRDDMFNVDYCIQQQQVSGNEPSKTKGIPLWVHFKDPDFKFVFENFNPGKLSENLFRIPNHCKCQQ